MTMIFPLGWQKSSGKASGSSQHYKIREDRHIISVDNYYENIKTNKYILFKTANTGGVNIIKWDESYDNHGCVNLLEYGKLKEENHDLKNIMSHKFSSKDNSIFEKIKNNFFVFMDQIITGWNPCGILTYFTNPNRKQYKLISSVELNKYDIKFWACDQNDNTYKWFYIRNKDEIVDDQDNKIKLTDYNKNFYKVIWKKSGAWANWRNTKILQPNEYFSDTFICCYFKTYEQCENFISYFKTFLYRFLISKMANDQNACRHIHKLCPNLSNIKNPRTNKIGWNSDWTNEDIKVIMPFITNDEWLYIEQEAIKSDGNRK